ncbi:MAG: hypothetical protein WBF77_11820 [Sulfurimonadaceae bacterium]
MKHVYLTKEEIDRSYRSGAITVREVQELLKDLDQRAKSVVKRDVEHKGSVTLHKVAQH